MCMRMLGGVWCCKRIHRPRASVSESSLSGHVEQTIWQDTQYLVRAVSHKMHTMPCCQAMSVLLRAQPKIPAEEMRPTLLFFRGKCTPLKYNWKNNADNMGKLMRFHVRPRPGRLVCTGRPGRPGSPSDGWNVAILLQGWNSRCQSDTKKVPLRHACIGHGACSIWRNWPASVVRRTRTEQVGHTG